MDEKTRVDAEFIRDAPIGHRFRPVRNSVGKNRRKTMTLKELVEQEIANPDDVHKVLERIKEFGIDPQKAQTTVLID